MGGGGDGTAGCSCMEFVAGGWCTKKWLKLYQTMRNLTSGDLEILVIQLGVTGLEKTRVVYLLVLSGGRGEKGQCDLACVERL